MITSLSALEISDQYQALMKILETDPTLLGDFLSSPVNMETKEIYPISNYGSGNVTVLYGTGIVGRCVDSGGNPFM